MRYVITATKRNGDTIRPCEYVGCRGVLVYDAAKAYVFKTLPEAEKDAEYFRKNLPGHAVAIERIPATGRVANAVLKAVPIET